MIHIFATRLRRALATWPDADGWVFAAGVGLATLAVMALVGFSTGLYAIGPARTQGLPLRLATVLIAPAIGEEAIFRGLLIPDLSETPAPWRALALGTAIFVLWHVVEAATFLPAAAMFYRADFLACAGLLGLGAGLIRWRTQSLWPGVGLHWLMVTVWQTWLGGFVP